MPSVPRYRRRGRRSARSSARQPPSGGHSQELSSLVARYRRQPGLDLAPAADLVDEVDGLVLSVGTRDPEPHRRPAPEAEAALLGDRPWEHDGPALDLVIDATSLAHAADVHLELFRDMCWQVYTRALGHLHRMPRVRRKVLFVALLSLAALATAGAALATNGGFTPQAGHSPNAHRINDAYYLISAFTIGIFVIVESTLVVFIIRYRSRGRARTAEGPQLHGHTRLEIIWTAIPVVIIAIIFGFVFYELPGISGAPTAQAASEELTVHIVPPQFYWQFPYPNGAVSIDQLHLPVDRVVKLTINSKDVN